MTRYRVTNRYPHYFTPRFLSLLARTRQHLIGAAVGLGLFTTIAHADAVQPTARTAAAFGILPLAALVHPCTAEDRAMRRAGCPSAASAWMQLPGCTSAVDGNPRLPAPDEQVPRAQDAQERLSHDTSVSLHVAGCSRAAPFEDVITLAEQGVPELALHLIDQQQTSIDPLAREWFAWEQARILIYQQRRDWASVVRRTQALVASGSLPLATLAHPGAAPDNLPLTFTRWILTQGAAAQLELGQGAAARTWLLRLIWQPAAVPVPVPVPECPNAPSAGCAGAVDNAGSQLLARPPGMAAVPETRRAESPSAAGAGMQMSSQEQLFGQWRRMVIHSYIMDGRVDDAYTALLRYQQDYANSSTNSQIHLFQAHVLLSTERAAEAVTLLAGMQEPTAAALYLLARLRNGGRPENILQEVRQLLTQQPVTASHVLAAVVQVEAAQLIGDHEPRVEAMEYILAHQGMMPSTLTGLVNITGDSVWDAYVTYAQMLSNQQQLLMGNFDPWFAVAQSLAKEHPIRARALFAFLAMHADTVEIRLSAHQQLITLLGQLPQGAVLMRTLYAKLDRFR